MSLCLVFLIIYKVSSVIFVSITDNGKGISPQIMPKPFKKFSTDSDIGTGLGLFIPAK